MTKVLAALLLSLTLSSSALAAVPDQEIEAFYKGSRLAQTAPSAVPQDAAGRRKLFQDLASAQDAPAFLYAAPADLARDQEAARALSERFGGEEARLPKEKPAQAAAQPPAERPLAASAERVTAALASAPGALATASGGQGQASKDPVAAAPAGVGRDGRLPSWNLVAGLTRLNGYVDTRTYGFFRRKPLVDLGQAGTGGVDVGIIYSRSQGERNAQAPDLTPYQDYVGFDPYTGAESTVYAKQPGTKVFELGGPYIETPTFKKRFSLDGGVRGAVIDSNPRFDIINRVRQPYYNYGMPTFFLQESKIDTVESPTGGRSFGVGYVIHAALNATLFKLRDAGTFGLRVEAARLTALSDKRAGGSRLTFGLRYSK